MKNLKPALALILGLIVVSGCGHATRRTTSDFTGDWKFHLGDTAGAEQPGFDDNNWRSLDLPHDWSIEGNFDSLNPATPGGGALPGGIGWYRKIFTLPAASANQRIFIDFDGVYRNSTVWINGHLLGMRPNGYISFRYELTPWLKKGGENTLAVRVDNAQQPNSRWYSGSGIYRNVWLVAVNDLFVDHWGTAVITPKVSASEATVLLSVTVRNAGAANRSADVVTTLFTTDSVSVAETTSNVRFGTDSLQTILQEFTVKNPELWSTVNPALYSAVTRIRVGGTEVDSYRTPFGIRSAVFDADKGFLLNGQPLKIYGVCEHHDLGALGAALNVRAVERRLQTLKEMGVNGIRTSHNPPAPELLDMCDTMGFVVIDEAFDIWKRPKNPFDYHLDWDAWHVKDLQDQILRDRNHPSVVAWSIGNEVPEQSFIDWRTKTADSSGVEIARELADIVRALDPTRPVTAATDQVEGPSNAVIQSGAIDIIGYNYRHKFWKDAQAKWGKKPLIASESASAFESRGDYIMPSDKILRAGMGKMNLNPDYTASSYDNYSAAWGSTHEESLKEFMRLSYIAGTFIWTGWDYLGEPTPYTWPARSSYFGVIDLAGFPKDGFYLYQSLWTDKPVLHILPHWNWEPGQQVDVWAYYSQADEVELFLNGRSLGVRSKQQDDLHVMWRVPFEAGTLKAVSRMKGKTVFEQEVRTAGKPARIVLTPDRTVLKSSGSDLCFVTVQITDEQGNPVPRAGNAVQFTCKGQGTLVATDNGSPVSHESFLSATRKAYNGKCLAIVRASKTGGTISLTASSEGLQPAVTEITVK
jgi:beta-galactosidase